ncbi:MAG TPA: hypothetical protein PLZ93_02025 [Nocardioides sp.]|nr:hypothetical protein [Nocardioides sp.]HRI94373.1 hypothetical protein [Nocardioides sp.]HRK44263.1 hypothetical protein [Nocardioides sp.]
MSKNLKRGFEGVLTVIWLGGTAFLVEEMDSGWRWLAVVALLAVVVAIEVVFIRWNEGHWPGVTTSEATAS